MKLSKNYLSLVVLLVAVALGTTACPPPFFSGTSFHDNVTETALNMPQGAGILQKTIAPGFLSLSAINDDSENDVTIKIYGDLGFNQTGRRLSMWNHTTQQYQTIVGNEAWANAEIAKQIEFRPYVDPANVNIRWDSGTMDTHQPVLLIDISDAMNTTPNTVGQVWQITIKRLDWDELNDGTPTNVNSFETASYGMGNDHVYYFREGSGDTDRPDFVSFNIEGNEVGDGDTAVPIGYDFQLVVNDSEGLGDLWVTLVDQGDSVGDPNDDTYIPLPTKDHSVDASENHTYTLGLPKDMEYSTTYKLMIVQATGSSEILPVVGAYMPFTQDLSGNSIDDTQDLLTRVDITDIIYPGQTPAGIYALTRSFTTQDAPE